MISFDLKCGHGHVFEGWFRSSEDYAGQREGRLIACPICGNAEIAKAVMAPAVAAKGNRSDGKAAEPAAPSTAMPSEEQLAAMLGALAEAQAKMLEQSQWVGGKFAEQARAIHYGEQEPVLIHGSVDKGEARALMEEGVPVAPLIVPVAPPDSTH